MREIAIGNTPLKWNLCCAQVLVTGKPPPLHIDDVDAFSAPPRGSPRRPRVDTTFISGREVPLMHSEVGRLESCRPRCRGPCADSADRGFAQGAHIRSVNSR